MPTPGERLPGGSAASGAAHCDQSCGETGAHGGCASHRAHRPRRDRSAMMGHAAQRRLRCSRGWPSALCSFEYRERCHRRRRSQGCCHGRSCEADVAGRARLRLRGPAASSHPARHEIFRRRDPTGPAAASGGRGRTRASAAPPPHPGPRGCAALLDHRHLPCRRRIAAAAPQAGAAGRVRPRAVQRSCRQARPPFRPLRSSDVTRFLAALAAHSGAPGQP